MTCTEMGCESFECTVDGGWITFIGDVSSHLS